MAARDFAEVSGPAPQGGGGMNWRAMFVVVAGLAVVGGAFVVGYSLGEKRGRMLAEHAGKQRLLDEIARQKKELAKLKKNAAKKGGKPGQTEVGELTFYNDLPRQAVTPAPLSGTEEAAAAGGHRKPSSARVAEHSAKPSAGHAGGEPDVGRIIQQTMKEEPPRAHAPAPSAARDGDWRVQVGSYQRREDAEALASRARGQGFPATVEQTMVPNLGMWFRVYVGPYASREAARAAQARVRDAMHISGLLLRGRK